MITIIIPQWAFWAILVFLFFNGLTVGIDTIVRTRIYRLLLKMKSQ